VCRGYKDRKEVVGQGGGEGSGLMGAGGAFSRLRRLQVPQVSLAFPGDCGGAMRVQESHGLGR